MLAGGRDISHLPYEWQQTIVEVIAMKTRIEFGVQILDKDLDDRMKVAIEACQAAISKKRKEKET